MKKAAATPCSTNLSSEPATFRQSKIDGSAVRSCFKAYDRIVGLPCAAKNTVRLCQNECIFLRSGVPLRFGARKHDAAPKFLAIQSPTKVLWSCVQCEASDAAQATPRRHHLFRQLSI
ncbi:hypothetical protein F6P93_07720 [Escherichia coli]|nr:hypothetical protein F6P93_07720 [Escherichia coli]